MFVDTYNAKNAYVTIPCLMYFHVNETVNGYIKTREDINYALELEMEYLTNQIASHNWKQFQSMHNISKKDIGINSANICKCFSLDDCNLVTVCNTETIDRIHCKEKFCNKICFYTNGGKFYDPFGLNASTQLIFYMDTTYYNLANEYERELFCHELFIRFDSFIKLTGEHCIAYAMIDNYLFCLFNLGSNLYGLDYKYIKDRAALIKEFNNHNIKWESYKENKARYFEQDFYELENMIFNPYKVKKINNLMDQKTFTRIQECIDQRTHLENLFSNNDPCMIPTEQELDQDWKNFFNTLTLYPLDDCILSYNGAILQKGSIKIEQICRADNKTKR